jgi:hypothetical protein
MDILGVELLREVGDYLVDVLRRRVPLLPPDEEPLLREEPLLPDLIDVRPRSAIAATAAEDDDDSIVLSPNLLQD